MLEKIIKVYTYNPKLNNLNQNKLKKNLNGVKETNKFSWVQLLSLKYLLNKKKMKIKTKYVQVIIC